MLKNRIIAGLIVLVLSGICFADDKNQTIRDLGEKVVNLYKNSGREIDKSDLKLFIEDNSLESTQELIGSLEQYKTVLEKDILSIKTAKKPSFAWKALLGIFGIFAGTVGINAENQKVYQAEYEYWERRRNRGWDLHYAKTHHLNARSLEPNKYLTNNEFDQSKFDAEYPPIPALVPYVMQNIAVYNFLIVGGAVTTLFVAYKLYNYLMYSRNKKKEIILIDEIVAHLAAIE